jgi:hypothetical protein
MSAAWKSDAAGEAVAHRVLGPAAHSKVPGALPSMAPPHTPTRKSSPQKQKAAKGWHAWHCSPLCATLRSGVYLVYTYVHRCWGHRPSHTEEIVESRSRGEDSSRRRKK